MKAKNYQALPKPRLSFPAWFKMKENSGFCYLKVKIPCYICLQMMDELVPIELEIEHTMEEKSDVFR